MEPRIATLLGESAVLDRPTLDPISLLPPPSITPRRPHPGIPSSVDDARTNAASLRHEYVGGAHSNTSAQGPSHRQKSSAPIAEVLNNGVPAQSTPQHLPGLSAALSTPPAFSGRLSDILLDPTQQHPNKRRKVDGHTTPSAPAANANENSLLTLPKLPQIPKKASRRHRIPPLLQGLHQPPPLPPEGRLFPPITGEAGGFRRDIGDGVGSRRPDSRDGHTEKENVGESSVTTDNAVQPEGNKDTVDRATVVVPEVENHSRETADTTPETQGRKAKEPRKRKRWSDQETKDLLHGVSQFGIGNWKKILNCSDFNFNDRTAVDLKDRFRTCCPGEGLKLRAPKSKAKSKGEEPILNHGDASSSRTASNQDGASQETTEAETSFDQLKPRRKPRADKQRKGPTELAEMGIQAPFFKNKRRERREFTKEDDENLLKGYEKHGTVWHAMKNDKELNFVGRNSTDLRDRFRIRYPEIYAKAGYKLKPKDEALLRDREKDKEEVDSQESAVTGNTARTEETPKSSQKTPVSEPLLSSVTKASSTKTGLHAHALLHPLMGSFDDFSDIISEDGDGSRSPITLSRNIFQWADANPSTTNLGVPAIYNSTGVPSTADAGWHSFPAMDGLHIDPRAILKLPMGTLTSIGFATTPSYATTTNPSALSVPVGHTTSGNTTAPNTTTAPNPSSSARHGMDALLRTPNLPTIVYPHVPMSSARNAMHNLPPPADLLSGMEYDAAPQRQSADFVLDDGMGFGFTIPSNAPTLAPLANTSARAILNMDRSLFEEPFGDRSLLNSSI